MSQPAGPQVPEHVFLHSTVGGSDKVYPVWLKPEGDGWVVTFQYGKRTSTLKPGSKTQKGPVPYLEAKKIYDKVVRGQLADGYRVVGGEAPAYVMAANGEKKHSGVNCQLLNPIDDDVALQLNRDPSWLAQEKHDGVRMLLQRRGDEVQAINRTGIYVGFPEAFQGAARSLPGEFTIDGEAVGEQLRAFDILERDGVDLRDRPVEERLRVLTSLLRGLNGAAIIQVETAYTAEAKTRLYERLKGAEREGIVYKKMGSAYAPGRPGKGGDQLKRKFWESCSAVAGPVNDKRSVPVNLLHEGEWINVGNCTIPVNHPIPAPDSIIEVRYLYAYPDGGLFQPCYKGQRSDIKVEDCTTRQLKYKSAEEIAVLEAQVQAHADEASSAPRM